MPTDKQIIIIFLIFGFKFHLKWRTMQVLSCQNTRVRYGAASIIVGYLIFKKIYKKVRNLQNQRKIKDKRCHLAQKKKNLEERYKTIVTIEWMYVLFLSLLISGILLTNERKDILSKNIEDLQSDLKCGKLKPIEVLQAYQAKVKFFSSYLVQGESKKC